MRLDGDKIVDVSEQDTADLRAYLQACASGKGQWMGSVGSLRQAYEETIPFARRGHVESVGRFVAMVGLALADAPKASPAGSDGPFRGILARADETIRGLTPKGFTTPAEIEQATRELAAQCKKMGSPSLDDCLIPDLRSTTKGEAHRVPAFDGTEEDACARLWSWLTKRQRDCAHNAGDSSNVVLWESRHRITQGHDIDAIRPLVRWIRSWQ